ncbi:MAG TPA: N-acetylmuramoyl-L-alanine amidase [Gemmatimonadales bacterium]|nr:N-acetylmuramoyl-L-alanine amidase [Gemmatimonadales bacterium]
MSLVPRVPRPTTLAAACAGLMGYACGGAGPRPAAPEVAPSPVVAGAPAESLPPSPDLPPMKAVRGPLALQVVYPPSDAVLQIRDSSFVFGTAGSGDARVTIDGQPARVWPNGAWLGYVALPADSLMQLRIEARTATDSTSVTYPVRRRVADAGRLIVGSVWLDSLSLAPTGQLWLSRGEYVPLSVRASEGAEVRLRLPDGTVVPLTPQPRPLEVPAAVRAFERDTNRLQTPIVRDRYVGLLRGRAVGPDPGPILPLPFSLSAFDTTWAVVEAIHGSDTARVRWPLQAAVLDSLPVVTELVDDTARSSVPDDLTVGRALPGGTYAWFFPNGTRAAVTGRRNGDLRLRLSSAAEAWVPVVEARPLAPGGPAPQAVVGSISVTPHADRASVRIPLTQRVPFRIEESDRTLVVRIYGASGDVDWMRYGASDSLISRMSWRQASPDEVTLDFELSRPVWGYRARWNRNDLVLDIRRPPAIDASDPLRDRLIAIDPGHPPGGASGPTGFREAEANLAVALELRRLLEAAGARVLMTRTADSPVELWPRVAMAEQANADVLVSIHNNALPDGLNPFVNNGTSVYYNQPRSEPLARAVQTALLRRLGLRDLGFGRGDLALVRGTWMPSVLTEGLFMMFPDQEAALRAPEGQRRYAQGVAEGLRKYLEGWARTK